MFTQQNAYAAKIGGCEFAIITTSGVYYCGGFDHARDVMDHLIKGIHLSVDIYEKGQCMARETQANIFPTQLVAIVSLAGVNKFTKPMP